MQHQETYRIMGIDPGTNYMGYGVLEIEGRNVRSVVLGDIDLHKLTDPYAKLRYIFERVGALIDQYAPREVALESPFFGENVQSMLKLGRAQGVAMAAALSRGLAVSEYAPMRIKQSITGRGSAAKEQVAAIVCRILSIDQPPRRLDATDGMAVALCHHFTTASPLNTALGDERVKGLGGGKKSSFETRLPELGEIPERPSRPGDKIAPELLTMKIITVLLSAAFLLCNCGVRTTPSRAITASHRAIRFSSSPATNP